MTGRECQAGARALDLEDGMLSLLSVATWLITANPPIEEGRAFYLYLEAQGEGGQVVLLTVF